jgi:hypothetical protein
MAVLSQIRDSPTWRARSPYLFPPRSIVAQLNPQALGPLFVAFYDSQGYGGRVRIPPQLGRSVKLLLVFASTVIPGLSLLEIHDQRQGVRVRVTLRLAVYRQSVRLGDKPLETHDQ